MAWDGGSFIASCGPALLRALFAAAAALPCLCAVVELWSFQRQTGGRSATGNAAPDGEQAEDVGDRPTPEARAA
jgi:hypothetical protein